jgi:hypothetical protein
VLAPARLPLQVTGVDPGPVLGLAGGAVGTFLTTLLVGAVLVALAPDYVRTRVADVVDQPAGCAVYGAVALIFLALATVVLAVTVVGLVVAVPLALATYFAWAVGSAVAFLAVGDRLVGHANGWPAPLLVGAAVNGLLALTGVGGLVSLVVGAVGFGAVVRPVLG